MDNLSLSHAMTKALRVGAAGPRLRARAAEATALALVISLSGCNQEADAPAAANTPLHVSAAAPTDPTVDDSQARTSGAKQRERTDSAVAPKVDAAQPSSPTVATSPTVFAHPTAGPPRAVLLRPVASPEATARGEQTRQRDNIEAGALHNGSVQLHKRLQTPKPAANKHGLTRDSRRKVLPGSTMEEVGGAVMPRPGRFAQPVPVDVARAPTEPLDRENYAHFDDNPVKLVAEHPVSTFSIDVDTGGYANVRRFLNEGRLPPHDAVRVEELINYFDYAYVAPSQRSRPFSVTSTLTQAPWHPGRHLLRIGVQGYEVAPAGMPSANLVFLVDVSGSMRSAKKLGLLKSGLKLLARQLRAQDRISLVVYAGGTGVVLPPTPGDRYHQIERALDGLRAGGRTNGAAGIELAYQMASQGFIPGGINRVLLATDGNFNVGTTNLQTLKNLVERQRRSGVSLTTLGFGTGNYNESLMEQLADTGNGNYAYIDTLKEANKVLVQQMSGTLHTIAKDVKVQIEFNPALVSEYRLIGYENRALRREDFNNDKVDAGEIGAGHNVTALYELTLAGGGTPHLPALRYGGSNTKVQREGLAGELAHLRIRYKAPTQSASALLEWPLQRSVLEQPIAAVDDDFRFAAAVAGFGQLLRGGKHLGKFNYDDVLALAHAGRGADVLGYRAEFVQLVALARSIQARASYRPETLVQTADR